MRSFMEQPLFESASKIINSEYVLSGLQKMGLDFISSLNQGSPNYSSRAKFGVLAISGPLSHFRMKGISCGITPILQCKQLC